jgi:hypothetical protein
MFFNFPFSFISIESGVWPQFAWKRIGKFDLRTIYANYVVNFCSNRVTLKRFKIGNLKSYRLI